MTFLNTLERAAADVISILKGIDEFAEARIAVIGGMALWKYCPDFRTTQDVDFIINIGSAPTGVKQKLLALPNSPFTTQAQFFYYQIPGGPSIQIDITPDWQSPYMPDAARIIKHTPSGFIPYITPTDLIIFKINSCGLRATVPKKRRDASDAEEMLKNETRNGLLSLTSAQKAIIEPRIADVVANGTQSEQWWRERLGMVVPK